MINTKSIRWIMVVVVMFSSIAESAEERIVWQQGVDYIAVKKLPGARSDKLSPTIPEVTVKQMLAGLKYEEEANVPDLLGYDHESASVFSASLAERLGQKVYAQLVQLSAGEVVTFSVSEIAPQILGLGGKPVTTSGTLFYANGALQLIVGELRVNFKKRYIRAGYPIQNGRYPTHAEMATFRLETGNLNEMSGAKWKLLPGGKVQQQVRPDWISVVVTARSTNDSTVSGVFGV